MDRPKFLPFAEGGVPLRHVPMYIDASDDDDYIVAATEQDYEDFCAGVMLYTRLFGLTDWHISFRWEDNSGDASACVYYNHEARAASFIFGRRIDQSFRDNARMMMKLALHETLHLLFAEFDYAANVDNFTLSQKKSLLDAAEHRVIRKLENVLMALPLNQSDDYLLHRLSADNKSGGDCKNG